MNDLSEIGIEKNVHYECITTTIDKNGKKNAGAFGFQYLGGDKVYCSIFEGSKTLKNILDTNEYVVNITQNPLVFTYSTLDCLDDEYYTDDDDIAIIKNTPAFIIVDVDEIEIKTPENFPIQGDNNIYSIVGKIRKVAIKRHLHLTEACLHLLNLLLIFQDTKWSAKMKEKFIWTD